MMVLTRGSRGCLIGHDPGIGDSLWRPLEDCQGVTVLDLRVRLEGIEPGKRAYDWLVRGRGYGKFSAVPVPCRPGMAKFREKEIAKSFGKAPKSLRKVHILGKLVDNTGYRIR